MSENRGGFFQPPIQPRQTDPVGKAIDLFMRLGLGKANLAKMMGDESVQAKIARIASGKGTGADLQAVLGGFVGATGGPAKLAAKAGAKGAATRKMPMSPGARGPESFVRSMRGEGMDVNDPQKLLRILEDHGFHGDIDDLGRVAYDIPWVHSASGRVGKKKQVASSMQHLLKQLGY